MSAYFRSRNFPIHLLAAWWVLWLTISRTRLNEFIPPSLQTLAQFALLILSFLIGHQTIKRKWKKAPRLKSIQTEVIGSGSARLRLALGISAFTCGALLLLSLYLSGAFTSSFIEYFAKLRMDEGNADSLTGVHVLDVLTKILTFPLSYTVILIILAVGVDRFRMILLFCVFNLLAYSYLWQVNYPLIHLFWLLVFHWLIQAQRRGSFNFRTMAVMFVLFATLLASSVNRFGGDILGGLRRYIVGYHLIGFSFYDFQFHDSNSILHVHSFGRSSLGFLDQMLEALSKMAGIGYKAASFENSTFNNQAVDIGLHEVKEFNAFGTLLFSLYRDFNLFGVVAGGYVYGALTTASLYRSANNWAHGALFLLLASSWMMGMMVNPLEQAYFWFAVVALNGFVFVNRGSRYRVRSLSGK